MLYQRIVDAEHTAARALCLSSPLSPCCTRMSCKFSNHSDPELKSTLCLALVYQSISETRYVAGCSLCVYCHHRFVVPGYPNCSDLLGRLIKSDLYSVPEYQAASEVWLLLFLRYLFVENFAPLLLALSWTEWCTQWLRIDVLLIASCPIIVFCTPLLLTLSWIDWFPNDSKCEYPALFRQPVGCVLRVAADGTFPRRLVYLHRL